MYVKQHLIVICVVLLGFSECKKCDDNIFKCVVDWVASTLTADSNDKLDTIETSPNKPADGIILTELTEFLVNNFSGVFRQGPFVEIVGNDTNIYVQSLDINDSSDKNTTMYYNKTRENSSDTDAVTQLLNDKAQDIINDILQNNSEEIINPAYLDNTPNIDDIITSTGNMSIVNMTLANLNITENNNTDTYNQNNVTSSLNFTSDIIDIIENIETTTVFYKSDKPTQSEHKSDKISNHTIHTEEDAVDDTYDFFSNNEIDVGEFISDNITDYLDVDYIDLYKDTTNEDVQYTPATYIPTTTEAVRIIVNQKSEDGIDSVYQWIAAVFVMNSESNRFEYVCDGALISERVVLTAARCVIKSNMTADGTNVLIILGKRSLQSMGPNEKVVRVKSIKIHDNFNSTEEEVDLAGLVLAESVITNVDIQPALLAVEDKSGPLAMATTGWHVTGPLQPLYLGPITADICVEKSGFNNTICAVLSDSETTCPSFGGLLVDRQDDNQWLLKGIATGDPTTNGVCFNKNLVFTRIGNYLDWISKIEASK